MSSDADAPDAREATLQQSSSLPVSEQELKFSELPISEQELEFNESIEQLDRSILLDSSVVRLPTLPFPSAYGQTRLSLEALNIHNRQSSASLALNNNSDANMASTEQQVFDDYEETDYDDMASSRSSDLYSPHFEPSYPSLVDRIATPDTGEPDELSLSGDTFSNAETVSDQLESQDDIDSFENITHEDIADDLRTDQIEAEELDNIMRSDHTIVPPSPIVSQHLAPAISETNAISVPAEQVAVGTSISSGSDKYDIAGFSMAYKPYSPAPHPLRLLFVADKTMHEEHQLLVIAKIMSAVTGKRLGTDAITEASDFADDHIICPFHQKYKIHLSENKSLTVGVDHAVAFSEQGRATLKNGCVLNLNVAETLLPDFSILFHVPLDTKNQASLNRGVFPQGDHGRQFARALSKRGVAMVEISLRRDQSPSPSSVLASTLQGKQDQSFLHIRNMHSSRNDDDSRLSNKPAPIPLDTFSELDNTDLSRHLASISKQHQTVPGSKQPRPGSNGMLKLAPSSLMFYAVSIISTLMVLASIYIAQTPTLDPLSDLTVRQDALQLAMNKSAIDYVNVSSVLHYPTTTAISSGTTTVGLAFPTAVDVHVAKSDQLFVAFPKAYRSSAYIGLFRNGKNLNDYNVTKLIDGVYGLKLKQSDAYGQVHLMFRSTTDPALNETVKVDLGNRLLHRATYENAARGVQHNIQRDVEDVHHAAKVAQAKFVNNTHSALKVSASRARALRKGVFGTMSGAAQQVSLGYKGVTNSTSALIKSTSNLLLLTYEKDMQRARVMTALARNASSAISTMFTNQLPGKGDFARARNNSLKLKGKLLRKPTTPVQNVTDTSVFSRFVELGRQAAQFPRHMLSPDVRKLLYRPRDSGTALANKQVQKAFAKKGETVCQKETCSKNNAGGVTCAKTCQQSSGKCAKDCKRMKGETKLKNGVDTTIGEDAGAVVANEKR